MSITGHRPPVTAIRGKSSYTRQNVSRTFLHKAEAARSNTERQTEIPMKTLKTLMVAAAFTLTAALVVVAQTNNAEGFVGQWKNAPGQTEQHRTIELVDGVLKMTEAMPTQTIIRYYPTNGTTVKNEDPGFFNGAVATGTMAGNVLTVETTMANGTEMTDVWTLSDDGKSFTNQRIIRGDLFGKGGGKGGAKAEAKGGAAPKGGAKGGGKGKGGGGADSVYIKVEE
jgi:hypothetical protein